VEEAGIPVDAPLIPLDAVASIPATHFRDRHLWGPDLHVVTERAFGARLNDGLMIHFRVSTRIIVGSRTRRLPGCSGGKVIARRHGN
jgi:hypothetical protein